MGVIAVLCMSFSSFGQDFMMQGWYWDYPKPTDPNGNPNTAFTFAKTLNNQVSDLSSSGFTYVWLPPLSRSSFGHNSNGYDPKDLYDLGGYGLGATGFGFEQDVTTLINTFNSNNIKAVADVVYNHRDGGLPEKNSLVEEWIRDFDSNKVNAGDNAFPSDRFRCILPLGGNTGNGAGTYYITVKSRSGHSKYFNKPYVMYTETNLVGWQNLEDNTESEPNCSGDNNPIDLGVNTEAWIDATGCLYDEFKLTLSASDFNASGDSLYIYITNVNGDYSDHDITKIWSANASADIESQLIYQTYTDHTQHASGRGGMNFLDFKPNGNPTQLAGDWDWMWFFYDYDQGQQSTVDTLTEWTKWLWNDVGIRGFRLDAVKHFPESFVGELMNDLNSSSINPGMLVGEFYDSNAGLLKNWVDQVRSYMNPSADNAIDIRIFDFALRQSLKDACDVYGYDARNVFNSGLVDDQSASGYNVVSFVNNHDFRDANQSVQNDPMLAYAYILTNNKVGLPCVYYPDYYGISRPNAPTVDLESEINNLINIHKDHIFGSQTVDYLNRYNTPYSSFYVSQNAQANTSLIYQLTNNPNDQDVVVAINFAGEELDVYHQINMGNVTEVNPTFTLMSGDLAGDFEQVTVNNELHIKVPPRSYLIYLEDQVSQASLPLELIEFNGVLRQDAVELSWLVGLEENIKQYVVERSFDGEVFSAIGAVASEASNNSYQFNDNELPAEGGLALYRLRIEEYDGSLEYSGLVSIDLGLKEEDIILGPTLVSDIVEIRSESIQFSSVQLINSSGQILETAESVRLTEGFTLDVSDYPSGLYKIRFEVHNGQTLLKSFVKL